MAEAPARSEEEVTTILMALVAWAGNASAASRYLKSEKGITISTSALSQWKTRHTERLDELREKYQAQLEGNLAHELRDVARLAVDAQRLAIERTLQGLKNNKERDPARAAANLATVSSKNIDKLMTVTSRPTQITENRQPNEILASLIARHPQIFGLKDGDQPREIPEAVEATEADDEPGSR